MKVELKPMELRVKFAHGGKFYEVKQQYGHAAVLVDGTQCGIAITDPKDPNYRVLHPLSKGYPQAWLDQVVKASNGRFTRSLKGPVPEPETEEEDDEFEG